MSDEGPHFLAKYVMFILRWITGFPLALLNLFNYDAPFFFEDTRVHQSMFILVPLNIAIQSLFLTFRKSISRHLVYIAKKMFQHCLR